MKTIIMPGIAFLLITFTFCDIPAQETQKKAITFLGDPIMIDSTSTLIIPVLDGSTEGRLSYSKIDFSSNHYENIIFYNFNADSSKRLFKHNTKIEMFDFNFHYATPKKKRSLMSSYLFYKVYNYDYNKNGKINITDPGILYVSDKHGNNLARITPENENVVSVNHYEKLDFILIKLQRDENNDGDFEMKDKDFYFIKLDLKTLKLGNKIELK